MLGDDPLHLGATLRMALYFCIMAHMATPGVYVYKRNGRVAYVGRSDRDVYARESASFRSANYDLTVTIHERSSPFQAYRTECRLFHKHEPSDNDIHPAVPAGAIWWCPVNGCCWS